MTYNLFTNEVNYNSTKTFVIQHPDDPAKYLVHACLEGPEAGIYYRGKGIITDNTSTTIDLPEYVKKIGKNFTIQITPIYSGKKRTTIYEVSEPVENHFQVFGENGSFYWSAFAERGEIEVEPLKSAVKVSGEGPYRYIH